MVVNYEVLNGERDWPWLPHHPHLHIPAFYGHEVSWIGMLFRSVQIAILDVLSHYSLVIYRSRGKWPNRSFDMICLSHIVCHIAFQEITIFFWNNSDSSNQNIFWERWKCLGLMMPQDIEVNNFKLINLPPQSTYEIYDSIYMYISTKYYHNMEVF